MCVPTGPTEKQGGGFPVKGAACPRGWTVEVLRISTLDMAPKVSVRVADVFRCPSPRLGLAVQGCSHSGYQSWKGLELGLDLALAAAEWWFSRPVPVLLPALSTSPVKLHKQTKQNTASLKYSPLLLTSSCSPAHLFLLPLLIFLLHFLLFSCFGTRFPAHPFPSKPPWVLAHIPRPLPG